MRPDRGDLLVASNKTTHYPPKTNIMFSKFVERVQSRGTDGHTRRSSGLVRLSISVAAFQSNVSKDASVHKSRADSIFTK